LPPVTPSLEQDVEAMPCVQGSAPPSIALARISPAVVRILSVSARVLIDQRGAPRRAAGTEDSTSSRAVSAEQSQVLPLYVDRFNRRDWDGLRELIAADARLRVADRFAGRLADSPYFGRYARWTVTWRRAMGEVDGQPAIVIMQRDTEDWAPTGLVRLDVEGGRVTRIADYLHCPWILSSADSVFVSERLTD